MTDKEKILETVYEVMEETTKYIEDTFNEKIEAQQKQIDGLLEIFETLVNR